MSRTKIDPKLKDALVSIYEEVLWLSVRPNVTAGRARAWYTHIMAESVKKQVRRFSGLVSRVAVVETDSELRLEHFNRIQTTLTDLVERHQSKRIRNPNEFVRPSWSMNGFIVRPQNIWDINWLLLRDTFLTRNYYPSTASAC